jgi:hypothetical protein
LFNGDIAEFMEQVPSGTMVGGIRRLLQSQFGRLTPVEVEIVRLLANAPDPVSFAEISEVRSTDPAHARPTRGGLVAAYGFSQEVSGSAR